jgi:hypothetical protein
MHFSPTLLRSTARIVVITLVFCGVIAQLMANPQGSGQPLSPEDIVDLLKGDVPSSYVVTLVRKAGISFELTPEIEKEIRQAGGTDALLATLRELAPKVLRTVIDTSPNALVYCDGIFQGQANSQGRLVIESLKPGEHSFKISLAGMKDFLQQVTVEAGQETTVRASLEVAPVAPAIQYLTGKWHGIAVQDKPQNHTFPVTMELKGESRGTIDYPSFTCGGSLEFRGVEGSTSTYTEHIHYGKGNCIDGGTLKVSLAGDSLHWDWSGGGVTAVAILNPGSEVNPSPGSGRRITSIRLPSSANIYVDVDPNTNKVFTSGGASGGQEVAMIDGSTNRVVATLGTGSGAHVNPVTGKVYAAGVYSGSIYVYSSVDGHLITTVKAFDCPVEATVDSSRNVIWGGAQCGGGNDPAFRIDGSTDTLTSGEIGSGGVMSKIVVNPATHVVYVFAGSEGGEGKIDPGTLTRAGVAFSAIVSAINPQTNRLYGAAVSGSGVEVIDGSTEAVLATLPVSSPGPIAVDTTRNRVYVIDNSASPPTLKVFDGATNSQIGAMPLSPGDSSATMAVNSNTHTIYLLVNNNSVASLLVLEDGL